MESLSPQTAAATKGNIIDPNADLTAGGVRTVAEKNAAQQRLQDAYPSLTVVVTIPLGS